MLAINFVASLLNEYTRGESSYPVTPRTMKYNIERGWKYDDNEFRTNQLIHPFNGATYFNSARDNGIGFWGSSVMALAGAYIWECCGESQPMSWNDMVSTGLGGISRGEMGHRVSGLILDNRSSGDGRFWRELAAGLFDPVGWFNRIISGRGSQVGENPGNPYDWRPPNLWLHVAAGFRVMGEGESITENTHAYGLLQADLAYGSAFTNESRRPFDRFDAGMQLNVGDKMGVGRIEIRGDIWSTPLGASEGEEPRHVLAVTQDFDYINNEAYEYGGQGLGLALFSRLGGGRTAIKSRVTTYVVAGAAVNADYSFLADIPDPRQLRDYDYGAGAGGALEFVLDRPWGPLAFLGYRYTLIDVRNGSIYNPTEGPARLERQAPGPPHQAGRLHSVRGAPNGWRRSRPLLSRQSLRRPGADRPDSAQSGGARVPWVDLGPRESRAAGSWRTVESRIARVEDCDQGLISPRARALSVLRGQSASHHESSRRSLSAPNVKWMNHACGTRWSDRSCSAPSW